MFLVLLAVTSTRPVAGSVAVVDSSLTTAAIAQLMAPSPVRPVLVGRRLDGSGLHRTLLTDLQSMVAGSGEGLRVVVVETITSEVYLDVDEVQSVWCV